MLRVTRIELGLCLLILLMANSAHAARILVTTTADEVIVNNNCSLREAVLAANTDTWVDRCHGGGPDTIFLPTGVFLLSLLGPNEDAGYTGDLDVTTDITIRGTGAGSAIIDGGALDAAWDPAMADRVFHIAASGRLAIVDATIRGGACAAGAGFLNAGTLSLTTVSVQEHVASSELDHCEASVEGVRTFGGGAILNTPSGSMVVSQSVIAANSSGDYDLAAGILNLGTAAIVRSLVTGNRGASGTALWNLGQLTVTDTQISYNFGRFSGAALLNDATATLLRTTVASNTTAGSGGAIYNRSTMTIDTSTISGNIGYAATGSVRNTGDLTVVSSTIADNTSGDYDAVAGITNQGQARLSGTILANRGGNCVGPIESLGSNLATDDSCGLIAYNDLPTTDPMLGPLADNGGWTPTHALLDSSPARDRVPVAQCSAIDQRHVTRPHPREGQCDAGAFEWSPGGEVGVLIERIRVLTQSGALTGHQEHALIRNLKQAEASALAGRTMRALSALDEFSVLVQTYQQQGSVAPELAATFLAAAERIRAMLYA